MIPYPTDSMLRGRRRLEEMPEVDLLKDWTWDDITECFYLHIRLRSAQSSQDIPHETEWYVTATASYPFGPLKIYPGCENSLTSTFPHQACNASVEKNGLWREGSLCVNFADRTIGFSASDKEPFTVDDRLFWNLQRSVLWLNAAANGTLAKKGDHFELPEFSHGYTSPLFAFQEDCVSTMIWEDSDKRYGTAKTMCKRLSSNQSAITIKSFQTIDGKSNIFEPIWGTAMTSAEKSELALWIMLKETPVINVWQAPVTLSDLKTVCTSQGIDLLGILKQFAPKARDGQSHLVLIGFPIPKRIGEDPCEISWQAFELPILSNKPSTNRGFRSGKKRNTTLTTGAHKGFRPGEKGWWMNDKINILTEDMKIHWLHSENWSSRSIKDRGKLPGNISNRQVAIIGVGSLGASIAELLVRAGSTKIACIDGDILKMGNLCRHTLTARDIFQFKSSAIVEHLHSIDPNAQITAINDFLSLDGAGVLTPDLSNYNIIIDTTGEDHVLNLLSMGRWKNDTVICSGSVGLGAKRLYINIQKTSNPCFNSFLSLIKPYLQRDSTEYNLDELPRDGIGCWHPAFPARSDDMWLAACATIKVLESFIDGAAKNEISVVYESQKSGRLFTGLQLVEEKHE